MIIGFSDSAKRLALIAGLGENKLLIDGADEKLKAREYLRGKLEEIGLCRDKRCLLEKEMVLDALYEITKFPERSFSVNPLLLPEFPVCSEASLDCNRALIPLAKSTPIHIRIPVVSGAMFSNHIDYVSISPTSWEEIVGDLDGSAEDHETEKEQIRAAVDRFEASLETFFDTSDWPGWGGNLIPQRGEQDCVDESLTLVSFFSALDVEGRLKHYSLPSMPISSVPGHHNAFSIERKKDFKRFVVDPWNGSTTIVSEEVWEEDFEYDRSRQQKIWSTPKF